jgi:hypothetical protein
MRQKNTKQMSMSFIKYQMDQGKLNLTPDYQREAVWTTPQKQLLIDSLLNGIDIPKLYFHQRKQIPPEFDVVDGQQRIRAVTEFLEGGFKMAKDADPVDGHPCAGLYFGELATDLQGFLVEANFDVVVDELELHRRGRAEDVRPTAERNVPQCSREASRDSGRHEHGCSGPRQAFRVRVCRLHEQAVRV